MSIIKQLHLILPALLILGGCATWEQNSDQVLVRGTVTAHKIAAGNLDTKDSKLTDLHEFGMMSTEVYAKYGSISEICGGLKDFNWTETEYNHKHKLFRHIFDTNGFDIKGLQFKVWKRKNPANPPMYTIAFRGTEAKDLGDWFSNFRWVTRLIPFTSDQYDQTRKITVALIAELLKENKKAEFIATGHSLGGGLAQQAGYVTPKIKTVYAFAPSAVTGFFSVDADERAKNKAGMEIYRVYERGEILAALRKGMKLVAPLTTQNPKIVELRYNFQNRFDKFKEQRKKEADAAAKKKPEALTAEESEKLARKNAITEHSILDLTCSLKEVWEEVNRKKS